MSEKPNNNDLVEQGMKTGAVIGGIAGFVLGGPVGAVLGACAGGTGVGSANVIVNGDYSVHSDDNNGFS